LKTYKTGESFGELALMYTAPRAATIICSKPGILYGLDRQTFKGVVEEAANKRRQKFRSILSKVSILS
jgi:cAMP-dependent protein kinase regulator